MAKIMVVGSLNMDLTIQTDRVPGPGETVSGYGFITNPGGKGANQAAAAARLGAQVEMVGAVGQDGFGRELVAALNESGAGTGWVLRTAGVSTGVAMIIVQGGENRILLDAGANGTVSPGDLDHALEKAQAGDYLVAQLEIPQDTVLAVLRQARQKGVHTLLNPAPAVKLEDAFFEATQVLVPNEHECAILSGIYPKDEDSARKAGAWFRDRGVETVVITMGEKGAALYDQEGLWLCPSPRVKAIDSTAAGDCFIGALTTALTQGKDNRRAVWLGTRAGALAVTRLGAQQSLPDRRQLEEFICREKQDGSGQ